MVTFTLVLSIFKVKFRQFSGFLLTIVLLSSLIEKYVYTFSPTPEPEPEVTIQEEQPVIEEPAKPEAQRETEAPVQSGNRFKPVVDSLGWANSIPVTICTNLCEILGKVNVDIIIMECFE